MTADQFIDHVFATDEDCPKTRTPNTAETIIPGSSGGQTATSQDPGSSGGQTATSQEMIATTTTTTTTYPTEARLRQKQRLKKAKEQGLKPQRRKKDVEAGNDDCGDDISGLGPDAVLLSSDIIPEQFDYDSDDDDSEDMFLQVPISIADNTTDILTAVPYLCYGRHNAVDLIELCGGQGRISQVAIRRGLLSGGNLDLVTGCNLDDPRTQKAIMHYLETCDVLVAILQPNCRTTGRNSYYNAKMHYDTWHEHHTTDLPHIRFCGDVALRQVLGRFFLRDYQQAHISTTYTHGLKFRKTQKSRHKQWINAWLVVETTTGKKSKSQLNGHQTVRRWSNPCADSLAMDSTTTHIPLAMHWKSSRFILGSCVKLLSMV